MNDIVQHSLKIRINKQIVTVNCPPFTPLATLNEWLAQYKLANPEARIISRSWSANASAEPK